MSGSCLISAFGLAVILSQISAILSADIVPVVLLGGKTPESTQSVDALRIISKNEFLELVWNIVGGSQPAVVVFAKDNLCVEELSQTKLQFDDCHSNYLPLVESPLPVLENLKSYNVSTQEKPETITDGQLIIVKLTELTDIPDIYKALRKKSPKVVGVIAGVSCSYSRSERTRRAIPGRAESEVIAQTDNVLLYVSNGIYLKGTDDTFSLLGEPITVSSTSSVVNGSNNVRFDMTFGPNNTTIETTLRLQFRATTSKYWYFDSVEYETNTSALTLISNGTIFFPFGFSYHCAKNMIFTHNYTTYLNFTDLQVQIDPTISTTLGTAVFSDGYDCIGFTTIPILSALFVTAILALIMIWALTMIMDIRTMDRFDDPKGKTITIAASE